jgi:uncharacterized protein (TIGR03083 family)
MVAGTSVGMMDSDEVFALTAIERRRAADMFDGLDDEQWGAPSLCSQWTVRDVAGHLVGPFCMSTWRFVLGAVASAGFHRYSVKMSRELAKRPTAELVATLRANAEHRFAPPGTGPLAPLTDLAVHTRDVARPLGLPASASLDAWRAVLDFLASAKAKRGFVARGRLNGLRFTATDQQWDVGEGPQVLGASEALALAIAGRAAALDDVGGEGLATLSARIA